jgi:hypothetical protein
MQSSYKVSFTTEADVSEIDPKGSVLRRLLRYAVCVGLGLLGGDIGVALAIGLAILIQLRLSPSTIFAPGVITLMVAAVLVGLGVSWLIGHVVTRHSRHDAPGNPSQNDLKVILVSSVFASLAQILFFFQ